MSKTQVVGMMSEWSGVLRDFFRQIADGSITLAMVQAFLEHKNPFAITDICGEWQEFYRKYFRLTVDFSDVIIPANPGGFDRVIVIPKGLTLNKVLEALRKQFKVWVYVDDLGKDVNENVRTADRNYVIRIRDRVEADEELKNLSANQLKDQGINALTLLERLVYELKYYSETNEHLDVLNVTLCAGSRDRNGRVPHVYWNPDNDRLYVHDCLPADADGSLRARQAVSS